MRWTLGPAIGPKDKKRVYWMDYRLEPGDPPTVAAIATLTITVGYSGPRVSYLLHAGRDILARRPWVETADHEARRKAVAELKAEGESWHSKQVDAALRAASR